MSENKLDFEIPSYEFSCDEVEFIFEKLKAACQATDEINHKLAAQSRLNTIYLKDINKLKKEIEELKNAR
jgi:hypothetical protein